MSEKKENVKEQSSDKIESTDENVKFVEEIEKLKSELNEQKNIFLRVAAEYENFRKRSEKEKLSIYSDATSKAVSAILPIADSLERALESQDGVGEDYIKGLSMINDQFKASLEKLGVQAFGNIGDEFNPDIHNAIAHIENEELGENVISAVFQKGYKISDKVIRHAMVQVAN